MAGVGHIRGAGPLGVLGGDAIVRHRRVEVRLGAARSGVFTGCMGLGSPCDLRDVSLIEAGVGVALGRAPSERAWTAGVLLARVQERLDLPRAMVSGYLRHPWPLVGALEASTELRAHGVPIRGGDIGGGWSFRAGLGLAGGRTG